jgi:hypothetical protein
VSSPTGKQSSRMLQPLQCVRRSRIEISVAVWAGKGLALAEVAISGMGGYP